MKPPNVTNETEIRANLREKLLLVGLEAEMFLYF